MPVLAKRQSVGDRAPLHVPPLRAAEGEDAVLREDVQTERVDALLVDDDKVLLLLVRAHRLVAYKVLELDNLPALRVGEAPFRLHELLALLGGRVEEPRVDLAAVKRG